MNKKILIIISLILLIGIILIAIVNKSFDKTKKDEVDVVEQINKKIDNKENFIIYIGNSSNYENEAIEKYLDEYENKYGFQLIRFDIYNSEIEYKKLKEVLNIDKSIYKPLMLISIKNGSIDEYAVHILEKETIEEFLKSVKII